MGCKDKKLICFIKLSTLLTGLIFLNCIDKELLHIVAEIFTIIVLFSIFTISWTARVYLNNNFLIFFGIISPLIGSIIFLHALTPLVGDRLPFFSVNVSFLLWLAGRYVMAFAFFMAIALLYKKDKLKPRCIFYIFLIFVIFSALLLFFKPFPVELLAENDPLAAYIIKILAVPILLILLISLFLLILVRKKFDVQVYRSSPD